MDESYHEQNRSILSFLCVGFLHHGHGKPAPKTTASATPETASRVTGSKPALGGSTTSGPMRSQGPAEDGSGGGWMKLRQSSCISAGLKTCLGALTMILMSISWRFPYLPHSIGSSPQHLRHPAPVDTASDCASEVELHLARAIGLPQLIAAGAQHTAAEVLILFSVEATNAEPSESLK